MPAVDVGEEAPDFALPDQHRHPVRLSHYRGRKNVVLVFYPLAFTPTCSGEVSAIRDEGSALVNDDVEVLAISCDSTASLRVFAEQQGVDYPLLSDFWPHGAVSRAYGVFLEDRGFPNRATFVIDRAGVVRWKVVTSPGEARDPADYGKALAAIG